MILVFTGIQGSGKGTQARLLAEKYDFKILEMGQELRKISESGSPLGNKLKEILSAGKLVSPDIVGDVMKESIGEQINMDLILDGYVRNKGNKKSLEEIIPNYKVVFFDLPKEKAIERLLGRMYDPITGESFVAGTEINPKNGNKLVKRHDDKEEAILTRINAFVEDSLPIVELQKKEGRVIEINADQSMEKVFEDLEKKLEIKRT